MGRVAVLKPPVASSNLARDNKLFMHVVYNNSNHFTSSTKNPLYITIHLYIVKGQMHYYASWMRDPVLYRSVVHNNYLF